MSSGNAFRVRRHQQVSHDVNGWGVLLVRTRKIVEKQAVQWVDGPKKTGGDGTGSDDRGIKSAGDGTTFERGTPQLNVQELGQEQ